MRTVDLRLAPSAAGCWAAAALALVAPTSLGWSAAGGFGAAALVLGGIGRRSGGPSRLRLISAAAACAITAAAALSVVLRIIAVEQAPIAAVDGKPVVDVEVAGDPTFLPHGRMRLPVTALAVNGHRQRPVAATLAATAGPVDPLPGERYRVRARVRPPRAGADGRLQAAQLTAVGDPIRTRGAPWWQRAAGLVRERLREIAMKALPERPAGLLPGLILGDVSGLDQRTSDTFRAAGLTHLVAVSGVNVR